MTTGSSKNSMPFALPSLPLAGLRSPFPLSPRSPLSELSCLCRFSLTSATGAVNESRNLRRLPHARPSLTPVYLGPPYKTRCILSARFTRISSGLHHSRKRYRAQITAQYERLRKREHLSSGVKTPLSSRAVLIVRCPATQRWVCYRLRTSKCVYGCPISQRSTIGPWPERAGREKKGTRKREREKGKPPLQ
jgi:hypothetical protein